MKNLTIKNPLSLSQSIWALVAILFIPLAISFLSFENQKQKIDDLRDRISILTQKIQKKESRHAEEEQLFTQISQANLAHLTNRLSNLSFLQKERQQGKMFLAQTEQNKPAKQSSSFLEETDNRLMFTQGESRKNKAFVEIELNQVKPVTINEEDLKSILQLLERTQEKGSPHTLIKSFELKKEPFLETEQKVYSLSLELITRQGSPL